jgi:hypothetical protein
MSYSIEESVTHFEDFAFFWRKVAQYLPYLVGENTAGCLS